MTQTEFNQKITALEVKAKSLRNKIIDLKELGGAILKVKTELPTAALTTQIASLETELLRVDALFAAEITTSDSFMVNFKK